MNSSRFATFVATSLGLAAFAAVALAGPGPQFWNRPATPNSPAPAPKPAACAGCKNTVVWVEGSRGPAGKGIPGNSVAAKRHECSVCSATMTTGHGANMADHAKTACASLGCCK